MKGLSAAAYTALCTFHVTFHLHTRHPHFCTPAPPNTTFLVYLLCSGRPLWRRYTVLVRTPFISRFYSLPFCLPPHQRTPAVPGFTTTSSLYTPGSMVHLPLPSSTVAHLPPHYTLTRWCVGHATTKSGSHTLPYEPRTTFSHAHHCLTPFCRTTTTAPYHHYLPTTLPLHSTYRTTFLQGWCVLWCLKHTVQPGADCSGY